PVGAHRALVVISNRQAARRSGMNLDRDLAGRTLEGLSPGQGERRHDRAQYRRPWLWQRRPPAAVTSPEQGLVAKHDLIRSHGPAGQTPKPLEVGTLEEARHRVAVPDIDREQHPGQLQSPLTPGPGGLR